MKTRRVSISGQAATPRCPACGAVIAADAERCPACGFTGADTMVLFPDPAPPLLPTLDAARLWNHADLHRIDAARTKLGRIFPQLQWRVCTVMLPEATSLPLFGFWMLNVCPLYAQETAAQRAWSVLLLIDARSGQAAVVPGYAAEPWLGDDGWLQVLGAMTPACSAGHSAEAVVRFFHAAARLLAAAWKSSGLRRDPAALSTRLSLGAAVSNLFSGQRRPHSFPAPAVPRRLGAPHAGGNQAVIRLGTLLPPAAW